MFKFVLGRFKSGLAHFPSWLHANGALKHQINDLGNFFFGLQYPAGPRIWAEGGLLMGLLDLTISVFGILRDALKREISN